MTADSWTASYAFHSEREAPVDNDARGSLPPGSGTQPITSLTRPSASIALRFEDVYRSFFGEVCRWVRALGGPEAERADLIQDVFLIVHRRLRAFDGQNLSGWLYQITRHRVRDFRRLCWFRVFLGSRPPDDTLVSSAEGPEGDLDNKEKEQVLTKLLSRLPESERTAFVLFEVEGYSAKEVATLQGVSVNTVRVRIYRARAKLAANLTRPALCRGVPTQRPS
jgi:RNA polymerase sigma-70 factor (ECF subfamily)